MSTPITPEEIAEARRLAAAATPGPWRAPKTWVYGPDCLVAECGGSAAADVRRNSGPRWRADAALIAFWRSFGPRLLAAYEALRTATEARLDELDARVDANTAIIEPIRAVKRERDEARAACAVMREALLRCDPVFDDECALCGVIVQDRHTQNVNEHAVGCPWRMAHSATAGRDELERRRRAEDRVGELGMAVLSDLKHNLALAEAVVEEMRERHPHCAELVAYDAGRRK